MAGLPGQATGEVTGLNLVDVGPSILSLYGIDAPEGVVVYIAVDDVDDVDAALERIKRAGGTPVTEKQAIPTFGWMARFRDSEGNLIGLFQEDPSVPMPAGAPD